MALTPTLTVESATGTRTTVDVEIVIPVYNEQGDLEASIRRLHSFLTEHFPFGWLITIADNASRDQTWGIACRLAQQLAGVRAVHLGEKGRGRALRAVWSASSAEVVAYMDVDLSTDLRALLPVVAPLLSGHSDLAVGSRLARGARVVRGPKREIISRSYNVILRATLKNEFTDAQCGFKALRGDVAKALLPLVEDEGWFFDTELLVLAERNGLRIHEVPVDWVDDPGSTVDVARTAIEDLQGIWRLLRRFASGEGDCPPGTLPGRRVGHDITGQLIRFLGVGAATTAMFAVLFLLLAAPLGPIAADVTALGICAGVNLAANRRLTFAVRGRDERGRYYRAGLALSALPLLASAACLLGLGAIGVTSVAVELASLTALNAVATGLRFAGLRLWVFGQGATFEWPPRASVAES